MYRPTTCTVSFCFIFIQYILVDTIVLLCTICCCNMMYFTLSAIDFIFISI